jgi:hypothetical protein
MNEFNKLIDNNKIMFQVDTPVNNQIMDSDGKW